jgi:GNAT superfamily N-acetyltransferase
VTDAEPVIRLVEPPELDEVAALYDGVVEALDLAAGGEAENAAWWERGSYPSVREAEADCAAGTLYVAVIGGAFAGAVTINGDMIAAYDEVAWRSGARRDECVTVHRLCVSPRFQRRGVARAMLGFAEDLAKTSGKRAVRLDTFVKNEAAASLYKSCGYALAAERALGYDEPEAEPHRFYLFEKEVADD